MIILLLAAAGIGVYTKLALQPNDKHADPRKALVPRQTVSNFARHTVRSKAMRGELKNAKATVTGVGQNNDKSAKLRVKQTVAALEDLMATTTHPEWAMRYRRAYHRIGAQEAKKTGILTYNEYQIPDRLENYVGNIRDPHASAFIQAQMARQQRFTHPASNAEVTHRGDDAKTVPIRLVRRTGTETNINVRTAQNGWNGWPRPHYS